MKHTLVGGLCLALTLAACGPKIDSTISHGNPSMPPGSLIPEEFKPLAARSIAIGYNDKVAVQAPFMGGWRIDKYPNWLTLSKDRGEGSLELTMTVQRTAANELTGKSQPKLQDEMVIEWWPLEDSQKLATTKWKVSADMFQLSGQVKLPTPASSGQDLRLSKQSPTISTPQTQQTTAPGVLVIYQSSTIRDLALGVASGVTTQSQGYSQSNSERLAGLAAQKTLNQLGIQPAQRQPLGQRMAFLDIDASTSQKAIELLKSQRNVISVTRNAVLSAQNNAQQLGTAISKTALLAAPLKPSDQYAVNQWAYNLLGYPAVWRDMETNPYKNPVVVAVLDSGVRYDHPDLRGKLLNGKEGALDFMPAAESNDGDGVDNDPTDPSFSGRTNGSHGTHVTGIIAANWGKFTKPCTECSDSGVVGASYTAPIKVLPLRVLDSKGNTNIPPVVNAIRYAAGLPISIDGKNYSNPSPVKVMNLSLGGVIKPETARPLCEAIAEVRKKGVLMFIASGNRGTQDVNYPAGCDGAVAVSSVTLSGGSAPRRSSFSSYYPAVQLSAPGGSGTVAGKDSAYFNGSFFNGKPFPDEILSTQWNFEKNSPNYEAESGTSQATPQVAALAALMLSKGITKGADDTLKRLIDTATDLGVAGRDSYFGYGMINAAAALNAPAVSQTYGVRLQNDDGIVYQPSVLLNGKFNIYVTSGKYTLTAGEDLNGNGVYGEFGEKRLQKVATVNKSTPQADFGLLNLE